MTRKQRTPPVSHDETLPVFGHTGEDDLPNRRENHLITVDELFAITTCAVCQSDLAPGDRYLCLGCASEGVAGVARTLTAERLARIAAGMEWVARAGYDPFTTKKGV